MSLQFTWFLFLTLTSFLLTDVKQVIGDDVEPFTYVIEMLSFCNDEMSKRNLEVLKISEKTFMGLFGALYLSNIRLGNMSEMQLVGPVSDQIFQLRNSSTPDTRVFYFDLKIGPGNMTFSLNYEGIALWLVEGEGSLEVKGHLNAFRLRGVLTATKRRVCSVNLESVTLGVFSGFTDFFILPKTIPKALTSYLFGGFLNLYLTYLQDIPNIIFQKALLQNEIFKAYVKEFMCAPFVLF